MNKHNTTVDTKETTSCDCNCSNSNSTKPYSIEKPASDRPLEAYAVGRIYQLEAQVEDQRNHIIQLHDKLERIVNEYRELMDVLKPKVKLSADGGMRKIEFDSISIAYCKYSQDKYYKLISLCGLQQENYQACVQAYKNEFLYGVEIDLSEDERSVVKADAEAQLEDEGAENYAD